MKKKREKSLKGRKKGNHDKRKPTWREIEEEGYLIKDKINNN